MTESRPAVQLVFVLRFLAASQLLIHPTADGATVLVGWSMLSVAVYVYNGVSDVGTDVANGSTRPIASGRVQVSAARRYCATLTVSGLGICAAGGWEVIITGTAFALLGWLYSAGRGLKANAVAAPLVIGMGATLTYLAGELVTSKSSDSVWSLLVVAAWVTLACSSKDFSDVVGDKLGGRKTLPVILGIRRAAGLLASASLLSTAGFLAFSLVSGASSLRLPAMLGAGSVFFAWRLMSVSRADDDGPPRRTAYKAYMAAQYVVNVGLALGLL